MQTTEQKPTGTALAEMLRTIQVAHEPIEHKLELYGEFHVARFVIECLQAFAILGLVLGVIAVLMAPQAAGDSMQIWLVGGAAIGFALLSFLSAQVLRAIVDTALYARQITEMMHKVVTRPAA